MADETFQLNKEALGKMVAEVGAEDGPGSSGWDAAGSATRKVNEAVIAVIGSMAGSVRNPPWYYNLVANPKVEVELNGEAFEARAEVIEGADRDRLFPRICAVAPHFAKIQESVERTVPVVELKRA